MHLMSAIPLAPSHMHARSPGMWQCDLETDTLTWSAEVYDIFGLPRGSAIDRAETLKLYHEGCRARLTRSRQRAVATGGSFSLDARIAAADGVSRWIRLIAQVERSPGVRPRIYGLKQDITAEIAGWAIRRALPDNDAVTGLAGPGLLADRLKTSGVRPVSAIILVQVDTGGTTGPGAGDECLRQIAIRLTRAFPAACLIARLDVSSFAVVLRLPTGPAALDIMLRRALMDLRRPVAWNGAYVHIAITMGAAIREAGKRGDDSSLLDRATAALADALPTRRDAIRIHGMPVWPDPAASIDAVDIL